MLDADVERDWFNLHDFFERDPPKPRPGRVALEAFTLTIQESFRVTG